MQNPAPIVLFVYNRPEHTRRTLKFLQQNLLADESRLFVYADAAAGPLEEKAVAETREVIQHISGFKSVKVIQQKTNLGLANSIIQGVTEVVNAYGKVIVFEDDLLSSPHTLTYFNNALERYQQEEKVMQISGYMFPVKHAETLPESFFFRAINSWGWATWKRAWIHFEPDVTRLYPQFNKQKIVDFSINSSMNYWKQLNDYKAGKNKSWAIRWYASVFLKDGLVLWPAKSLIENIGHDGTGVHSIIENTYQITPSKEPVTYFPDIVLENQQALLALTHFFKHRKGNLYKRGKKFLINLFHRINQNFPKK
ncbi:hypothetical protein SAMN05216436_107155 [bacterium A37T11]|nr:hypothetical protein SAMN05216436_107155 [bacterium A37T11]